MAFTTVLWAGVLEVTRLKPIDLIFFVVCICSFTEVGKNF
jgi:hypothetical protein